MKKIIPKEGNNLQQLFEEPRTPHEYWYQKLSASCKTCGGWIFSVTLHLLPHPNLARQHLSPPNSVQPTTQRPKLNQHEENSKLHLQWKNILTENPIQITGYKSQPPLYPQIILEEVYQITQVTVSGKNHTSGRGSNVTCVKTSSFSLFAWFKRSKSKKLNQNIGYKKSEIGDLECCKRASTYK